jgi:hypothetical protein
MILPEFEERSSPDPWCWRTVALRRTGAVRIAEVEGLSVGGASAMPYSVLQTAVPPQPQHLAILMQQL